MKNKWFSHGYTVKKLTVLALLLLNTFVFFYCIAPVIFLQKGSVFNLSSNFSDNFTLRLLVSSLAVLAILFAFFTKKKNQYY